MHNIDRSVGDAAAGLMFGGYFFFKGLGLWRDKRDIQNKPISKVAGVAMGDAELSGTVKSESLIKAPFSGRDCVYCSYAVEVPARNGWSRVDHGLITSIFYLDDGTGQILVNPEGATLFCPETYQRVFSHSSGQLEPGIASWLAERQHQSIFGSWTAGGEHRFTEYCLIPGQSIFVEGSVAVAQHVVQKVNHEEPIVEKRASGHYVLSTMSQSALLDSWTWQVPMEIFGGGALLLGCLWYLLIYFELIR